MKSYYAKSVMMEKKGWNIMSLQKTHKLSERFNFKKIDRKCFEMVNGDNKGKQLYKII